MQYATTYHTTILAVATPTTATLTTATLTTATLTTATLTMAQVPEPFNLSKARLDERGAARLRELAEHEMQECTFAPKTNEASATQLLARAMQHAA